MSHIERIAELSAKLSDSQDADYTAFLQAQIAAIRAEHPEIVLDEMQARFTPRKGQWEKHVKEMDSILTAVVGDTGIDKTRVRILDGRVVLADAATDAATSGKIPSTYYKADVGFAGWKTAAASQLHIIHVRADKDVRFYKVVGTSVVLLGRGESGSAAAVSAGYKNSGVNRVRPLTMRAAADVYATHDRAETDAIDAAIDVWTRWDKEMNAVADAATSGSK